MALYTKEQLKIERSRGLQMSDEENESYGSCLGKTEWTTQQFEEWLSTKQWSEKTKEYHRSIFKGVIYFSGNGDFTYW